MNRAALSAESTNSTPPLTAGLLAIFAVLMPMDWMVGVHGWLGLGGMPTTPVVAYLARSVALFYALLCIPVLLLHHHYTAPPGTPPEPE